MLPRHIIARKRDGHALTRDEILAFVRGATDGTWADPQLSALLMAIFLRGMTPEETTDLTEAVARSGAVVDLSAVRRPKVDKHSTGGVGDKVSLHLAPMAAACGLAVPMISGRGLGHTGGTLDKIESIPGFRVDLSLSEFCAQVARMGAAFVGQTAELAPADKKLYALRDITATVESIPLICASILGKKLAEGIDALVLDVKFGRGAFMPDEPRAKELATAMVAIGRAMGKPVRALLTAMEQPLGRAVGNALEVAESIACLRGEGPEDLMAVTTALGVQMLLLGKIAQTEAAARRALSECISSGAALAKFKAIVAAQGGDVRVVDDPSRLPSARLKVALTSERGGWVCEVDALKVASAALRLGAGRSRLEGRIDPAVGVDGLVKIGEKIGPGGTLCVVHSNDKEALAEANEILSKTIVVGDERVLAPRLFGEVIG